MYTLTEIRFYIQSKLNIVVKYHNKHVHIINHIDSLLYSSSKSRKT